MKTYFAYIRVSTVRQGEHGSSLQEQRGAIEAYAARHGLRIGQWFEERETAAKQGRGEFARLTLALRQGRAAGVVIHKIDRSARNLKDWALLGDLIDAGVEVLFAHEGLDMQTRGGRLAADIQAVVAADFIRNLRDEVRKGIYGRLKQGFYPLPAPRGYLDRGKAKAKEVCPIQGPLVRQAFELYATARFSLETLRLELARRGMLGSGSKPLSIGAMSLLLRNSFYMGLIQIRTTGEMFEGQHLPIVSKALFDRVQEVLAGRLYPRLEKHDFLFRRLVKCAHCGRSLTGERQRGHVYYRCHDRRCPKVSVKEEKIEEQVICDLRTLVLDDRDVRDFRDLLQEQIAREDAAQTGSAAHSERDLGLIAGRLSRLTDALIDGTIDKMTFDERRKDLLEKRRELLETLQGGTTSTFWRNVAEKFEQGFTAYLGYQSGNADEKREIVKLVSSNIVVREKEPVLALYFPFTEMKNWVLSTNGGPHRYAVRNERLLKKKTKSKSKRLNVLIKLIAKYEPVSTLGYRGRNRSLKSLSPEERRGLAERASVIQTPGHDHNTTAPAGRSYPRPLLPEPQPRRPGDSARTA